MTTQPPARSSLQLGALPTAPACARLHARHVLWDWGLRAVAQTAELVISELVTNSVKASQHIAHRPPVWLRLSLRTGSVLIEVWDGSTQPPQLTEPENGFPGLEGEGGRGLFLVGTLADRWDWYATQRPPGKAVWCQLSTHQPGQDTNTPQPSLPRRTSRSAPARHVREGPGPQMLRRVLDGLRDL
jgi:anti-sigma regulatory factor (Ser/Thr protein kinase)